MFNGEAKLLSYELVSPAVLLSVVAYEVSVQVLEDGCGENG